jgi:hypothetical protein
MNNGMMFIKKMSFFLIVDTSQKLRANCQEPRKKSQVKSKKSQVERAKTCLQQINLAGKQVSSQAGPKAGLRLCLVIFEFGEEGRGV